MVAIARFNKNEAPKPRVTLDFLYRKQKEIESKVDHAMDLGWNAREELAEMKAKYETVLHKQSYNFERLDSMFEAITQTRMMLSRFASMMGWKWEDAEWVEKPKKGGD